jgi:glutamate dehydrogenase/leucine dehydrogenase
MCAAAIAIPAATAPVIPATYIVGGVALIALFLLIVAGMPYAPLFYANAGGVAVNRFITYGTFSHYSLPLDRYSYRPQFHIVNSWI